MSLNERDSLLIIAQLYEQMNQDEWLEFLKYLRGEKIRPSENHILIDSNLIIGECPHYSKK